MNFLSIIPLLPETLANRNDIATHSIYVYGTVQFITSRNDRTSKPSSNKFRWLSYLFNINWNKSVFKPSFLFTLPLRIIMKLHWTKCICNLCEFQVFLYSWLEEILPRTVEVNFNFSQDNKNEPHSYSYSTFIKRRSAYFTHLQTLI